MGIKIYANLKNFGNFLVSGVFVKPNLYKINLIFKIMYY